MYAVRKNLTLISALALTLALVWLKPIDALAERHVEVGFQRALTTFAAARALNAILSLARSTEISVGVGLGASVHPGAILEPIDDLVEQFSSLMLAATTSFAAQRLLIEILASWPVCAVLSAALIALFALRAYGRFTPSWLPKFALAALCLRLAVPILALGSEATYQLLLVREFETSQAELKNADFAATAAEPGESSGNRFKRWWTESTDVAKKIDSLKSNTDGLVSHLARLAAVFVVQTIVLPLLFLWLLLCLYRALSGSSRPRVLPHELLRRMERET